MAGLTIGAMDNPVRGLLHGTAALVSVLGLVALIGAGPRDGLLAATTLYGLALVALYATSSLYHSFPWREAWKGRLQRLDHVMIYVLVAATFSPLLVATVDGPWVAVGLLGVWGLAAFGLARELWLRDGGRRVLTAQILVGSMCLVPLWLTLHAMGGSTAFLVLAGGIVYLLGVWMFVHDWPRLVPGIFSHHELFHVMVIIASVIHFIAMWRVVTSG
ncbi:MAG: PAQR family membrane homeostasis protein TrhA [Acidimicrobiia bacterium]